MQQVQTSHHFDSRKLSVYAHWQSSKMKLTAIAQANEAFANERHGGLVCVFAGAASGIGASTLEKLAPMLPSATFYVIGRLTERFSNQRATLERLNQTAKIIFFPGDVSLLSDVDAFSKAILDAEKKVDYLFMSPGRLPLAGAQCMPHPPSPFNHISQH